IYNRIESLDETFENKIKEPSRAVIKVTSNPKLTREELKERIDDLKYKITILGEIRQMGLISKVSDNQKTIVKNENTNDEEVKALKMNKRIKPGVAEVLKDTKSNITRGNILLSQKDDF
ncbi:hypothetical protein C6P44_002394, partial [Monosporozyma unispora]